jgi:UDP-glucuronate 4-epimerase
MRALVTGVAGFIGSHLAERLVDEHWEVLGVDGFTAYYEESVKRANIAELMSHPRFTLAEADLLSADLDALVAGADVVFHLAGQPGVRRSWADGFGTYNALNVAVTQRLLEAARRNPPGRIVFASSSSVYGNAPRQPTAEDAPTNPYSPYGITKLAAELLCRAYSANFGMPAVALRYFTVYGPRQRPDMALHRLIADALRGTAFPQYGDGRQARDMTFVGDVVEATVRAATAQLPNGAVLNVAGGTTVALDELIERVGDATGRAVAVERLPAHPGDVVRTEASTERAAELLGWRPVTGIEEGVAAQVAWHRTHLLGEPRR